LSDKYLLLAVDLINVADPDEAGTGMRIADDLMKARYGDDSALPICLQRLDGLLADTNVSSAELKGLLNRASNKTWGIQYDRAFYAATVSGGAKNRFGGIYSAPCTRQPRKRLTGLDGGNVRNSSKSDAILLAM
jgi:hypothetical protein